MAKQVYDDAQLSEKIMAGVDALVDTIKVTLGPAGRNVVLEEVESNGLTRRYITNDGATIAKAVELSDKAESMGALLIREVSVKTEGTAGDGTTTAVVLAQAILREGYRMVAAGANPGELQEAGETEEPEAPQKADPAQFVARGYKEIPVSELFPVGVPAAAGPGSKGRPSIASSTG